MTVSIPTTYSTSDITVGEGVAPGQQITSEGLDTIIGNHNFIGGNYRPSCADVIMIDRGGFTTFVAAGSSYYNLCAIPVLGHADAKQMTFTGVFTNVQSSDANVRLVCGGNTGSSVTLSAGATATTLTLTCDAETSDFCAAVQVNQPSGGSAEQVYLLTGSFNWSGLTGTQSDSPTSTGFVWAQSSELIDTKPVTVEQYNRFLNGPYTVWKGCPQSMGSIVWGLTFRTVETTSTSYTEVGRMLLVKRRPNVVVEFTALGRHGTVKLEIAGQSYEKNCDSGSVPAYNTDPDDLDVHSFSDIDLSEQPQLLEVVVYWKSTSGTSATLGAINAMVKK